jgi:hypothetical protein
MGWVVSAATLRAEAVRVNWADETITSKVSRSDRTRRAARARSITLWIARAEAATEYGLKYLACGST